MDKPLVFADLDDTLFQSHRKMAGRNAARQVAVAANGDPKKASFMTATQVALFDWLNTTTEVIPVTARSGDAYARVSLPFSSWAVISNGAVILEPDGTVHQPWRARMRAALGDLGVTMTDILTQGRKAAQDHGIDARSWIVDEDGMASYVVFKLNEVTEQSLRELEALPLPVTNWTRHFNAETLAVIPPGSGKAGAVDYLHGLLNPDAMRPTLGFGDSLSDLSYMTITNILMTPADSQIADAL